MRARERTLRSERGAVFVQVGISLFVLMSFNVFVLDYGVMWIARRQAQNAADAGALAGATSQAYDVFHNPASVVESAQNVAAANLVWQQPGTTQVTVTCPAGVTGSCVQVNVYRNGQNGSTPLPTLFGPILGINSQGVLASATGIVGRANATRCLKPWALPDEWREYGSSGHRQDSDVFNRWTATGLVANPDSYTRPSATQATTINLSSHQGDHVTFDVSYPWDTYQITPGFVLPLALPGGRTHLENMTSCNGERVVLGQQLSIDTTLGAGVAEAALQDAFALDAGAGYNYIGPLSGYAVNSCAPACAPVSPRLLAVALYDPDDFERRRAQNDWADCPSGTPCVVVANVAGFFIHDLSGGLLGRHGHFLRYPGTTTSSSALFVEDGSWLVEPHLIR